MRVDIQPYVSKDKSISVDNGLYVKTDNIDQVLFENEYIKCSYNMNLSFDTYFNSFSSSKWFKYSNINNLNLEVSFKGSFKLNIYNNYLITNKYNKNLIKSTIISSEIESTVSLEVPIMNDGNIHFELIAYDNDSYFYDFCYYSNVDEHSLNDIKLAINICTFKREEYVMKNIEFLNKEYLSNVNSELHNNIQVFIIDNGQSLDADKLSVNGLYIIKNKNAGGAGGFTRGLIEIKNSDEKFTHVVMMDDDVVIPNTSIYRLFQFLKLIKPEYLDSHIGGAMLRLDKSYIQHEIGAYFDLNFKPLKDNVNLLESEIILKNEIEETVEFFGWWFNCFNLSQVTSDNLPLPLFLKGDDVEYDIRNNKKSISLNGICIWHEPFEYKVTSHINYFEARNILIITSILGKDLPKLYKTYWDKVLGFVIMYKYNHAENFLNGIEDFIKGPEYLMNTEPIDILIEQLKYNDKYRELDELEIPFRLSEIEKNSNDLRTKKYMRNKKFNLHGYLLKSNGNTIVINNRTHMSHKRSVFYRKSKVLMVDNDFKQGYVVERSYSKTIKVLMRFIVVYTKLCLNQRKIKEQYKVAAKTMTSEKFWKEYLDI